MDSITLEDLYKKAVKEKYEEVKNGDDFFFLNAPTRGKLNKLCWEKFTNNNPHSNDLNVFNSLLGISFDINSQKKFKKETNPFRPIENFFKGESDPDKIEVVDMAAILVDFQPRPFNRFRKEIDEEDLPLYNELKNTSRLSKEVILNNYSEEKINENVEVKENIKEEIVQEKKQDIQPNVSKSKSLFFLVLKEKILKRFKERLRNTAIIMIVIFGLIGGVIYFAFFKKHCMQWSGDRYEIVDCRESNDVNTNQIIPIDKNLLDFKKIKACDTTTCFSKNGQAIVWYGRTANGIDYFNGIGNGWHPESGKALHPMTRYMFNEHLKNKPCE